MRAESQLYLLVNLVTSCELPFIRYTEIFERNIMQYNLVQLGYEGISQMSLHSTATGNTWIFRYLIEETIIKNIVKFAAIIR